METTRFTREAIVEKLNPKNMTKKRKKKKRSNSAPPNLAKQDYDEVELDDLEDR